MEHCQNCGTALAGDYCPQCGQKNVNLERPLQELLGEVLRESFDFDGRAARTLGYLFRRPGYLTGEFLAGRRKQYTPPFRLYLVISVFFFIVVGWVAGRGILVQEGLAAHDNLDEQVRFVAEDLPKLMFVLLPVFALLLKIAYRTRYYFDHLIHSLHLHCAAYILLALMLPLEQVANRNLFLLLLQLVLFAWLLIYCGLSLRRVYGSSGVVAAAKTAAVLFGYMTLLALALEGASHFSMADASSIPFFSD